MKKKIIIIILILILPISVFCLQDHFAQSISKNSKPLYKIGVLSNSDVSVHKINGMIEGLTNYGYNEEELDIIIKNGQGNMEKLDELGKKIVEDNMDVIVTTDSASTSVGKKYAEGKDIPLVFVGVGCTVELGYVEEKVDKTCNITGVDSQYLQLSGKRLEFFKKLVPDTEKILILYNPSFMPLSPNTIFLHEAARKFNVNLEFFPVESRDDIMTTISNNHNDFDGMMLMCSLLFEDNVEEIIDASLKYKFPVMGVSEVQVEKGLLGFYGGTNYDEGKQSSRILANILEGQDPGIIPIESPERLECHINVGTAKALGIEIDYSKLSFVDKFIE